MSFERLSRLSNRLRSRPPWYKIFTPPSATPTLYFLIRGLTELEVLYSVPQSYNILNVFLLSYYTILTLQSLVYVRSQWTGNIDFVLRHYNCLFLVYGKWSTPCCLLNELENPGQRIRKRIIVWIVYEWSVPTTPNN